MDFSPQEIEIVPVPDTFASGIGKVEKIAEGLLRVYLYAMQGANCGRGPLERVLVAKIVIPVAGLSPLVAKAMFAVAEKAAEIAPLLQ
jgi:hypothetical protein